MFMLSQELPLGEEYAVSERLTRIGIGKAHDFYWDTQSLEEENIRKLDLNTAKAYFEHESFVQDLRSRDFSIGVGGLNKADTLLFRALDLDYVKLSEEDIEAFTMQVRLDMPLLTSADPQRQVWSRFDHSEVHLPGSFFYRYIAFKQYYANLWESYLFRAEMREILGPERQSLLDEWDQEHAMVLGEGTKAGLFQSIMSKPANVRPVYPMTAPRKQLEVPSYLRDDPGLVIFNVEASFADDLMTR